MQKFTKHGNFLATQTHPWYTDKQVCIQKGSTTLWRDRLHGALGYENRF